jgi:hypothetical protein
VFNHASVWSSLAVRLKPDAFVWEAGRSPLLTLVASIFGNSAYAKIRPTIVRLDAVDVVNLKTGGWVHYLDMHENILPLLSLCLPARSNRVAVRDKMPLPFG